MGVNSRVITQIQGIIQNFTPDSRPMDPWGKIKPHTAGNHGRDKPKENQASAFHFNYSLDLEFLRSRPNPCFRSISYQIAEVVQCQLIDIVVYRPLAITLALQIEFRTTLTQDVRKG
jgi:hypothetical protein